VLANLLVLALLLGAFTLYISVFTNWAHLLGGLFTLTGAFAWLAFFTNLLSEDAKADLRANFEKRVLRRRFAWTVVLGAGLALIPIFPAWHGTLVLNGLDNEVRRTLTVRRTAGGGEPRVIAKSGLAERSKIKVLLRTDWFGKRAYRVKLSGLPEAVFKVEWLELKRINVPHDFLLRPVLVIRPSAKIARTAASGVFELKVYLNGNALEAPQPYGGESVWIGAGEDVAVPPDVIRNWSAELIGEFKSAVDIHLWDRPLSAGSATVLKPGDRIYASLTQKDGNVFATGCGIVREAHGVKEFPQQIVLNSSDDSCRSFAPERP
jgi:hypothetical protein